MKHIVATVAGVCLLLSSAGVVLANDVHVITGTKTTGQPGAVNGTNFTCGNILGLPAVDQGMPGNGTGVGSPFGPNGSLKTYAGNSGNPTAPTGPGLPAANGNANTAHAVSEYDVACFQATQHLP
jgi:hypothetical protein